ncbi:possible integral membrane protein [Aurantimonas manganoxydans SI85-9A1]|uniref:Possible integral membrane protein n=3 Tax=Aurantimonas manganoxydans TaxID=651183 RepID=Q1YKL9_AURMS|nr:possible integral membrane protein [Aurantimonas manganoxydans SI85-9A1]
MQQRRSGTPEPLRETGARTDAARRDKAAHFMTATIRLTVAAMIAFAGNSLLARLALADGAIDAAGFTGLRLLSGALVLAFILLKARGQTAVRWRTLDGSWASALALFLYALAFSLAYLKLGAAVGALILFAAVQASMIGWGLIRGERPGAREALGLLVAAGAFVWWLVPGLTRPDPLGTALMIVSGIAWGVYSLRGRGAADATRATAGNFIRTVPLALPLVALSLFQTGIGGAGLLIAIVSGAVTSGLGYVLWYRALKGLTALSAAIVQLSVPIIAALGGVLFLSENLGQRFVIAAGLVLGGIAFALSTRRR